MSKTVHDLIGEIIHPAPQPALLIATPVTPRASETVYDLIGRILAGPGAAAPATGGPRGEPVPQPAVM